MKTREELEKIINCSPLFSIDRVIDREYFVIEERRFLANLAELMSIVRKDFDKIGYEIILTAKSCIKAYKAENGVFLNYFYTALKKTLFTTTAKERMSDIRRGLTLDQKTDQTIRQIIKYLKACGADIHDNGIVNKLSEALNIPPAKVLEAIEINENIVVKSGNKKISNEYGEESELFDFIAAKTDTPEETLIHEEKVREIILSVDEEFQKQQERTKPLLSKLLTAKLLNASDYAFQLIEKNVLRISFIDSEIFSVCAKSNVIPTAREIAEANGVHEASASRTLKTFLTRLPVSNWRRADGIFIA